MREDLLGNFESDQCNKREQVIQCCQEREKVDEVLNAIRGKEQYGS